MLNLDIEKYHCVHKRAFDTDFFTSISVYIKKYVKMESNEKLRVFLTILLKVKPTYDILTLFDIR